MPWLQLKISASRDQTNSVEEALLSAGAAAVTLQDNANQPILEPALGETPLWDNTCVMGLFPAESNTEKIVTVISAVYARDLPPHQWEILEDKDWEREWMQYYHPIQCSEKLWICPSWCQPPNTNAINLLLDPGLAFGTGTHPTTFLCLQWLSQQDVNDVTLIDYGCGSGILGIAALLLGAKKVVGVDIDPQALKATTENSKRNHLNANSMPVYLPKDCPTLSADIIVANILAAPLINLAPLFSTLLTPGGKLCLSGILASQANMIISAYHPRFIFDPLEEQQEWVRLTAVKC